MGAVSIGSVQLDNPYALAPMAGYGDPPYRRLCRRGGAGLVCAEMVSANAVFFGDKKSQRMLAVAPDEHPLSVQIFGAEPERLAFAARRVEEAGADIVDLNCGCPVPKVVKGGAGVALMKDELLFARCVEAMVKAVKIPVTVKMRLGFRRGENISPRFASLARESGASALCIHARAREDGHEGPPDLDALAETVAAVGLPVFGNGGIHNYQDARRMMQGTGCAGVMVGRAAVGNPLLFLEFLEEEKNGAREPQAINAAPRFSLLREHAQLIVDYYGEKLGICRLRKYIGSYIHGLYGAAEFRRRAVGAVALNELLGLLDTYEASL